MLVKATATLFAKISIRIPQCFLQREGSKARPYP